MVQAITIASVGFPVGPTFYPCWRMKISKPAVDSVSYSVSVSVGWSALESAGSFLWSLANWTAKQFVCLPASRSVGWSAFGPEGCSVSCCAWRSALWRQLGPWAGPTEAACDWSSGAGPELEGGVQRNRAAGVSLGGREEGNIHYYKTVLKGITKENQHSKL